MRWFGLLCVVALFGVTVSAAAQTPPPAPGATAAAPSSVPAPASAAPSTNPDADYVLGPEDVIEVTVLGREDFTSRPKIGEDGTIQLPFIGSIQAAKKTTAQLAADITAALEKGGYFSNPVLRVEIVGYASRYVTVLGAVTTPSLVPVDRTYHLSEIMARVGGAKPEAADYIVLRRGNGAEQHYSIRLLVSGDETQDPVVAPGDKIFVPKAELFYISGQVKQPGAFEVESGMTMRMALSRAGGLTDLGSDHGIKVTGPDGKRRQVKLDDPIKPGDTIVVGERLF